MDEQYNLIKLFTKWNTEKECINWLIKREILLSNIELKCGHDIGHNVRNKGKFDSQSKYIREADIELSTS